MTDAGAAPSSTEELDEEAVYGPEVARIRRDVAALHETLVRYGLVVWTAGNVSARIPGMTSSW